MSRTENSNSKHGVNNNVESNSSEPVQSTQEKPNSHSATNQHAPGVTEETTSSTHSCTQSNGTRSRARKTRLPTNTSNNVQKTQPNVVSFDHVCPSWYRIVSLDPNAAESNESRSSSRPRKVQRTTNGRRNTAGITNSQSDVGWYRRVNRDVIASQNSGLSSRSGRLERRSESQHPTPSSSSLQAYSSDSDSDDPYDLGISYLNDDVIPAFLVRRFRNIVEHYYAPESERPPLLHRTVDIQDFSPRVTSNNVNRAQVLINLDDVTTHTEYQHSSSVDVTTHTEYQPSSSVDVTTHTEYQPSSSVDITTHTECQPSSSVDITTHTEYQPSSSVDITTHMEYQPSSSVEVNSNSVTQANEIIPAHPPTNSTVNNGSETLEIIIRSRNNADYRFVITNPAVIRMHKILQRRILDSNNTNNSIMHQQVNHYMGVLRSTIISVDSNSPIISSLMSSSVPRSLTIDQSSYPLLETAHEMPPVTIIDRIQNGLIIKELTNCVICLEDDNGNVLLEPCNHYNMCGPCMERLTTWLCPICRSPIINITVYV